MHWRARLRVLGFSCLILSGTCVFGQDQSSKEWKYKGEIFGSVGSGRFYHGDNHLGKGLDLGAGLGVRPFSGKFRGFGFEVTYNGLGFKNDWDGYGYSGDVHAISGNALYHFGRSRAQFYVVGGIGVLRADYTYRDGSLNSIINEAGYVTTHGDTKMAINLGAGVKARIVSGLALRPEIRFFDTTIGSGYNWSQMRLSIGVAWHF